MDKFSKVTIFFISGKTTSILTFFNKYNITKTNNDKLQLFAVFNKDNLF